MSPPVRILSCIFRRMLDHAREDPLLECCGFLAGLGGLISHTYPAANVAAGPAKAYEIDPNQIFQHVREMRASGLELLGIYHSHPTGENRPSARDIELAYYPETPYFILSTLPETRTPIRAFLIRDGKVTELEIQIV